MPVQLNGATSGSVTLTAPAVAGTNTLTLPAATGNVITSADSGTVTSAMIASAAVTGGNIASATVTGGNIAASTVAPSNLSQPLTRMTAQTAGAVTVTFTGIPSWAKRITLTYSNLTNSATSSIPLIQIGSGSLTATGYVGYTTITNSISSVGSFTAGLGLESVGRASGVYTGIATFLNNSGNLWQGSLSGLLTASTSVINGSTYITLGGVLDRIAITTNSAGAFTTGTVNVMYE